MKFRFCAALLLAALSIALFTGCTTAAAVQSPGSADPAPAGYSSAALPEQAAIPAAPTLPAPTELPAPTSPPETEPAAVPETEPAATASVPTLITKEEAVAIALKDAGFAESQVKRLRTEFDYDDGRPEYEVDFHRDGFEYDYEIHAETGVILSKDKDRED